ncbi:DUF2087 domain-containing protein [Ochrobactrum chromiisoli]|uniref:DUF2087 domain-containing protein n=1 Tax=Ochrobactrum chromiisoli TaxID=2993941 RepID=A0ABT3QT19_9HYPH|nr:DUF2087 domain-containing protein [Ochrobactrum chromiisoli]MCX2698714.1 DUF2087 domain-containing protein [Ochrobactrum chromiisoli]
MPRELIPLHVNDISALARSIRNAYSERDKPLSHVEILNILAKGAGFKNFQHLRDGAKEPVKADVHPIISQANVERVARCFDKDGVLTRFPSKRSDQISVLWVLWSRLPARTKLTEAEVNALLKSWHSFGDHALLRREICDAGLVSRTRDGSVYLRMELPMPPLAQAIARQITNK